MLWLGAIFLVICTVDGQGNCGTRDDCPGYLNLAERRNDPSLRPFFDTKLAKELLNFIGRCCESPLIPTEEVCGFPEPSGPINELQRRGAWPWYAVLSDRPGKDFSAFCGGTLVTRRHVLTGAHCLVLPNAVRLKYVRLGEYDLSTETEAPYVELAIAGFKEAGDYASDNKKDIAIITLEKDVEFNDFIRPACLPFNYRNEGFENQHLAVVGYGHTADSTTSHVPVAAVLPVVDLASCKKKYSNSNKISDSVICAGGGSDACQGDGGGPLNYYDVNTNRFYVVGIVSFGPASCGQSDIPGGYTRVGAFIDWINHTISTDFA